MRDEVISCTGSDLCAELAGSIHTSFTRTYRGDPSSRIIHRARDLSVLSDLSPLVQGHLLIAPRKHYLSFGYAMQDLGEHVRSLLAVLLPQYQKTFGPATILEHGSSTDMLTSACISHAHWHIVPVEGKAVADLLRRDGLLPIQLSDITELDEFSVTDSSYFYCSFGSFHLAYRTRPELPRQYLRLVVARLLGIPEPLHDYALVVRKHLLRQTMLRAVGWQFDET